MKITAFTPNPSIDFFLKTDDFLPNTVIRTKNEDAAAGGKGVNVSKALNRINFHNVSLVTYAGFTGKYFLQLMADENMSFSAYKAIGETRCNYLFDTGKDRYKINRRGPEIADQNKLLEWVFIHCHKDDILYIGGSLCCGMSTDFYRKAICLARERGIKTALDVNESAICDVIGLDFDYLKVNLEELSPVKKFIALKDIPDNFNTKESEIIISNAKEGAAVLWSQKKYTVFPSYKAPDCFAVGCGDVLFANYLAKRAKGTDIQDALSFSVNKASEFVKTCQV